MKYSTKKLKEIRDRYLYSFEFVGCGPNNGFVLLSNPFFKIPRQLPKLIRSNVITYNYYRKIFFGE